MATVLVGTSCYGQSPTNRDAAIEHLASTLVPQCAQSDLERLGISKEQCDQLHAVSIAQCKAVATTDLPTQLSQRELGRAMLRFSFCRGMVMQGKDFDLAVWEPTITQLLDEAHEEEK